MAAHDKVLGPLLVGTYANSILYTLELLAVIRYYSVSKRKQDPILLQAVVYFAFVTDTVSTISTYAIVYLYTVTHWGDVVYLQKQCWPGIVMSITTGMTETTVQCFLIYRYWKMSQNNYVTSALILFMLAALGSGVGTVVFLVYMITAQRDKPAFKWAAIIWWATSVASSFTIALALLWQLGRIKSPFKATKSLIHKLMVSTISTGILTSVVAVVGLILFVIDSQSNAAIGLSFCEARIFALTMLYNLNNRRSLTANTNAHKTEKSNNMNVLNEIHVHHTTAIHHESSSDHSPLELSDHLKDDSDSFTTPAKVSHLP